jgi:hypothetical protein
MREQELRADFTGTPYEDTEIKELSIWNSNDTVTKDVGYDRITMLEPTARNMHMLMLKINELVGIINELK